MKALLDWVLMVTPVMLSVLLALAVGRKLGSCLNGIVSANALSTLSYLGSIVCYNSSKLAMLKL